MAAEEGEMMGISEGWSLRYYDQHHEPHGIGVMVSDPPAFMQATDHPSGKALRYYADKKRTERETELERIAKSLYDDLCKYTEGRLDRERREYLLHYRFIDLQNLGVFEGE